MEQGGVIGDFDVAQLMVILFALFFVGLVLHLRQEDKREGYPLVDPAGGPDQEGFPKMPRPKTFRLMDGGVVTAPRAEVERSLAARRSPNIPGFPYVPTGDPLLDGVGPAAYAMRRDAPLIYNYGQVQVMPLRALADWAIVSLDGDPRGMRVVASDGLEVGVVADVWIDRSVKILRYLEVDLGAAGGSGRALLPIFYTDIKGSKRLIKVSAVRGREFAKVPRTALADTITALEEDKVNAFYAGARFFRDATSSRAV